MDLLQKPLLNPTILTNFCAVLNLPFFGKVIEKMIGKVKATISEDSG